MRIDGGKKITALRNEYFLAVLYFIRKLYEKLV